MRDSQHEPFLHPAVDPPRGAIHAHHRDAETSGMLHGAPAHPQGSLPSPEERGRRRHRLFLRGRHNRLHREQGRRPPQQGLRQRRQDRKDPSGKAPTTAPTRLRVRQGRATGSEGNELRRHEARQANRRAGTFARHRHVPQLAHGPQPQGSARAGTRFLGRHLRLPQGLRKARRARQQDRRLPRYQRLRHSRRRPPVLPRQPAPRGLRRWWRDQGGHRQRRDGLVRWLRRRPPLPHHARPCAAHHQPVPPARNRGRPRCHLPLRRHQLLHLQPPGRPAPSVGGRALRTLPAHPHRALQRCIPGHLSRHPTTLLRHGRPSPRPGLPRRSSPRVRHALAAPGTASALSNTGSFNVVLSHPALEGTSASATATIILVPIHRGLILDSKNMREIVPCLRSRGGDREAVALRSMVIKF
mmetsp:Transcript_4249/g.11079  ORF Transcript_4249/g.11079 Transcript_4249/m.11079 type:complete len:413 (+) Transcript_4249:912-2150(+)